jgi:hypothetical protein
MEEVKKERPEKTPGGSRVWISESFSSRLPRLWFREGKEGPRRIERVRRGDKDWTNSQV